MWCRSSRRSRRPPDWIIEGQVAADAPDWNIQGQVAGDALHWIIRDKTRRSGHNPQDKIIQGKVARRPGQDRPGRIKQEVFSPLDRTGSSTKDNAKEEQ